MSEQEKTKTLLFSITATNFKWDTFRSGGKGGQHQNKVESGVRCTHEPSGAVGTARDSRDQHRNRRSAFLRCIESDKFKNWHKLEVAKRLNGYQGATRSVDDSVDDMMGEKNLNIEYFKAK